MSVTAEHIGATRAHRPTITSLRVRLKPAHRSGGLVQGAWWPGSTRLADELPSLLAALSLRSGSVDQVLYHQSDWSPTPSRIKHQDGEVTLDASQASPNAITLFGPQLEKVTLLVVPPYTDASDAYTAMTTAASVGDASTPDDLLTVSDCSAEDRHRALIALHRWECEGGAVLAPPTNTAG